MRTSAPANDDRISGDTSGRYRADDAEGPLSDATAIVRESSQSAGPRESGGLG